MRWKYLCGCVCAYECVYKHTHIHTNITKGDSRRPNKVQRSAITSGSVGAADAVRCAADVVCWALLPAADDLRCASSLSSPFYLFPVCVCYLCFWFSVVLLWLMSISLIALSGKFQAKTAKVFFKNFIKITKMRNVWREHISWHNYEKLRYVNCKVQSLYKLDLLAKEFSLQVIM